MRVLMIAIGLAMLTACVTSGGDTLRGDAESCAALDAFHSASNPPAINRADVPETTNASLPERVRCPSRTYKMTRNISTLTVTDVSTVLGFDAQKTHATLTTYNIGQTGWTRAARPNRLCVAARDAQGWRVVGCVANLN